MAERFEKDFALIQYAYENFNVVPVGNEEYERMISGMQRVR